MRGKVIDLHSGRWDVIDLPAQFDEDRPFGPQVEALVAAVGLAIDPILAGATDPGLFYSMNLYIDDLSITLDPKSGVVTFKVSSTATGPITEPAV